MRELRVWFTSGISVVHQWPAAGGVLSSVGWWGLWWWRGLGGWGCAIGVDDRGTPMISHVSSCIGLKLGPVQLPGIERNKERDEIDRKLAYQEPRAYYRQQCV
jgi:hypothetical protein